MTRLNAAQRIAVVVGGLVLVAILVAGPTLTRVTLPTTPRSEALEILGKPEPRPVRLEFRPIFADWTPLHAGRLCVQALAVALLTTVAVVVLSDRR